MTTHCGFFFASGHIPDNMPIKAILGFNGQWQPWAVRDMLVEPKLDGLSTQEILANVSARRAYWGT